MTPEVESLHNLEKEDIKYLAKGPQMEVQRERLAALNLMPLGVKANREVSRVAQEHPRPDL